MRLLPMISDRWVRSQALALSRYAAPLPPQPAPFTPTDQEHALRVSAALCRAVDLLRGPSEAQVTRPCYVPVDTAHDTHEWVRTLVLVATAGLPADMTIDQLQAVLLDGQKGGAA